MNKLRKIPLEPLITILQELYDSGADYIDISGENNVKGEEKKDIIKISIKPEYLMVIEEEDLTGDEDVYIDYTGANRDDVDIYTTKRDMTSLSYEDIDDLI